jgi:hypothetical protein
MGGDPLETDVLTFLDGLSVCLFLTPSLSRLKHPIRGQVLRM